MAFPTIGGSTGTWGTELRDWLYLEHNSDGTLKNRPMLDVRADGGATGNGTTDDTVAIQAVITEAIATGMDVWFPPGYTYQANELTANGRVGLYGTRNSIIRQISGVADNTALIRVDGTGTTTAGNRVGLVIEGLQLRGRIDTDAATQYVHLLALSGVSDVTIRRVFFNGWRGDGLYIGSGFPTQVERHNERVVIENCIFDGINKLNRNGITIVDGTDIHIRRSVFRNCTATNRPGAIDIEPNTNAYHRIRNIHIEENVFENVGGNVGNICFDLNNSSVTQALLTTKAQGIFIRGNTFRGNTNSESAIFIRHIQTPAATDNPHNIVIKDNHILDYAGASTGMTPIYVDGVRGIKIRDNYIGPHPQGISFGYASATMDAELTDNHFHKVGQTGGTVIHVYSMTRLKIARNLYDNTGDGAGTNRLMSFEYNSGLPSVSSDIDMIDNRVVGFAPSTFASKNASHTTTASSNRAQGNDTSIAVPTATFTKQATLTYSRATETGQNAAMRTALAAAKLIVDATTA